MRHQIGFLMMFLLLMYDCSSTIEKVSNIHRKQSENGEIRIWSPTNSSATLVKSIGNKDTTYYLSLVAHSENINKNNVGYFVRFTDGSFVENPHATIHTIFDENGDRWMLATLEKISKYRIKPFLKKEIDYIRLYIYTNSLDSYMSRQIKDDFIQVVRSK